MLTIFIPDSVADEVHERQVPVTLEAGLRQATYAAFAADSVAIGLEDDQDLLTKGVYERDACYREQDGCGIIWGDQDGRGHWFGVVVGPDPDVARRIAQGLIDDGEEEIEEGEEPSQDLSNAWRAFHNKADGESA